MFVRASSLYGSGSDQFGRIGLPGTDIYIDAAGVAAVRQVFAGPKAAATLVIVANRRQSAPFR